MLTQLFEPAGNTSLEGVDTVNACYGATNALFNAVNWVESRAWDGRDAIVVASDIALYDQPASRPTGGAGCVAILVGPNAPLALDPVLRGTYMTHAWDFYKPNLKVEYPLVNGHESLRCYLSALDKCYGRLRERWEAVAEKTAGGPSPQAKAVGNGAAAEDSAEDGSTEYESALEDVAAVATGGDDEARLFDYMAFHTPNCKLVSKSYARLMYNDFLISSDDPKWAASVPAELRGLGYDESLRSKELEKTFLALSKGKFAARVEPCIAAPRLCGNMYTASLYCSLISLISNIDTEKALGKRIGMFSYGSGLASTLFTLNVTGDLSDIVAKIDIMSRLERRHVATPEEYEAVCTLYFSRWSFRRGRIWDADVSSRLARFVRRLTVLGITRPRAALS